MPSPLPFPHPISPDFQFNRVDAISFPPAITTLFPINSHHRPRLHPPSYSSLPSDTIFARFNHQRPTPSWLPSTTEAWIIPGFHNNISYIPLIPYHVQCPSPKKGILRMEFTLPLNG